MSGKTENPMTLQSFLSSWRKWEDGVRTAMQDRLTFDEKKHRQLRNTFVSSIDT